MAERDESTVEERLGRLADELAARELDSDAARRLAHASESGLAPPALEACLRAHALLRAALCEDDAGDDAGGHGEGRRALAPPELSADYELIEELGRGGMGVVWRARQHSLGRDVAVKVLRPGELLFGSALARFRHEARSLARLRHPHIVAVHEVGETGDNLYYTMDLVEGASLAELVAAGEVTPARAVRLLKQVAGAIAYTHSHGLIHRDLKPQNVLVDERGDAFVADFGLARDAAAGGELTTTGQLLGTPAYMAPEQALGDAARIGEASDVYALGAILYECLTGRPPFSGRPLAELIHAVVHEDPPPPRKLAPGAPRDLERIALKALAKAPAERYATARALLEDLERFEEGRPLRARPPSAGYRARRWLARHRAPVLSALVAGAAALLVAWLAFGREQTSAAVDVIVNTARDLERKAVTPAEYAEVEQLYSSALGMLGPDATERRLRTGPNSSSGTVAGSVWGGLLRAERRAAEREVEDGELAAAEERLLAALESVPSDVSTGALRDLQQDLVVLELRQGRAPEAFERLRRELLVGAEGGTPSPSTSGELEGVAHEESEALRTELARLSSRGRRQPSPVAEPEPQRSRFLRARFLERLRALLQDPAQPAYLAAGELLGRLLALTEEAGLDFPFAPLAAERDPTPAWIAMLRAEGRLTAAVRARLFDELPRLAAGRVPERQWGQGDPQIEAALAAVVEDPGSMLEARRLALDLFCLRLDLPWHPARSVEGRAPAPHEIERALGWWRQLAGQERAEDHRLRVHWAVELASSEGEPGRAWLEGWLRARTGVEGPVEWDAWWERHAEQPPRSWLQASLPAELTAAESASEAFERAGGAQRERAHHWLRLGLGDGQPAPQWPAGEPEPANLAATWRLGALSADERFTASITCASVELGFPHPAAEKQASVPIRRGEEERLWWQSWNTAGREFRLSYGLAHLLPELVFCPPALDAHLGRGPLLQVEAEVRLGWSDGAYTYDWQAELGDALRGESLRVPRSRRVAVDGWSFHVEPLWPIEGRVAELGPLILGVAVERVGEKEGSATRMRGSLSPGAESRRSESTVDRIVARIETLAAECPPTGEGALPTLEWLTTPDWMVPVQFRLPEARDTLRALDALAAELAADAGFRSELAALAAAEGLADTEPLLAGLSARFLPARLMAGDVGALDEAGFDRRLADAARTLELDAWWWYRLWATSEERPVQRVAEGRLASASLPAALLDDLLAREAQATPASLADGLRDHRRRRGLQRALRLSVALGLWAAALVLGARALLARRRAADDRRASLRRAALLAAVGLVASVWDVRVGYWTLLPHHLGLGILALGAWGLAAGSPSRAARLPAIVLAAAALVAGVGYASLIVWCLASANQLAALGLAGLAALLAARRRDSDRLVAWLGWGVAVAFALLSLDMTARWIALRPWSLGELEIHTWIQLLGTSDRVRPLVALGAVTGLAALLARAAWRPA